MENPAKVEAKLKIAEAVAGAAGGRLNKCFPPMAEAMTSVTRTGNQNTRSYL